MRASSITALLAAVLAASGCNMFREYQGPEPEDTATDADADGDTDADSDGDSDTDADGDTDTDADGDTDADADGDTDADTDADTDTDSDSDTDTHTDTCPDTGCEELIPCTAETAEELCGSLELCVDGWCCDLPCDGECEACDLSGLEGICSFVDPGEDPDGECDEEDPATCGTTGTCDGYGACDIYDEATPCGTEACPGATCDGGSHLEYPAECVSLCDGEGACAACTCVPTSETACAVGPGNQCCEPACDPVSGCATTAGACADVCATAALTVGRTCEGCGANLAEGACSAGTTHPCDADHACDVQDCGGVEYTCTNAGGTWGWREDAACDDGVACTFGDSCIGGACQGTGVTCTSTTCMTRTCNGTDTCTETPMSALTACGTTSCDADTCAGIDFYNYPANCTRYCSGTSDTCTACTCTATMTTCGVGSENQCCEPACDAAAGGCQTTDGACPETCTENMLTVGQFCVGCGSAGAEGICSGGSTYTCNAATHTLCQTMSCDGVNYRCTNAGGTWAWRTAPSCDDGNPCTYSDACIGESCSGTSITCASTACTASACNGTSACTEAPKPSTTACGTTPCAADYCTGLDFYDYPGSCTRYCSGVDDTCGGCTCTATATACAVGDGNECCVASCSETLGCRTVPGLCGAGGDTCEQDLLQVNQSCEGCGANGAAGACVPGGSYVCDDLANLECEERSCGGVLYYCLEDPVNGWGWTADPACDDGDPCTYDDACGGGACGGTAITCTSTACLTRTCNGTSTCTETPKASSTLCGTSACPADSCDGLDFSNYPATCTRTCSGTGDVCNPCTCTATTATCGVDLANECCQAGCDDGSGCLTTAGACADTCSAQQLVTGRSCAGCGPANGAGLCGGGTTHTCDAGTHLLCQAQSCGGVAYTCTNAGGVWAWRTAVACSDGDLCTYGDVCFGGTCNGTSITCASTDCLERSCNGTSACTEVPKSSSTECGTAACPADACNGLTWQNYPAGCTRYCSGTDGTCNACTCTAAETTCAAGGCCEAVCTPASGCSTTAGSCGGGETCGVNVIVLASSCEGCGAAGATGTCGGGGSYTCDAVTHDECQTVGCGGETYHCTQIGGVWQWRTSAGCDDGDACTYGDVCGAGVCQGTAITCTDSACTTRTCNGTSTCTEAPKPSSTACGSTACSGDYCASSIFYDYPASCTRTCSGTDDTCGTCSCTPAQTTCAAGGGNQCCTVTCTGELGCGTAAGTCADTCGSNLLTTGRTCTGCGPNLANGTCGGGTATTCDGTTHSLCQAISCGVTAYRCTNAGGSWAWRTAPACDDSNLCTYGDACSGETCAGTAITCTSDACYTRSCNGTSSCTETETTHCGDSTCNCGETSGTCPTDCSVVVNVLLLSPDFYASSPPDLSLITGIFASFGDCNTTIYNTGAGSPTVAELLAYDVVVVGNTIRWDVVAASGVEVGNALADYIDAGGTVIETQFVQDWYKVKVGPTWVWWYLEGRYMTDGYSPFVQATSDVSVINTLNVLDGSHPVMAGVSLLSTSTADFILNVTVRPGATELGRWQASNHPAIAVSGDGQVVAINARIFGDSEVIGDISDLLHNSVLWLAGY